MKNMLTNTLLFVTDPRLYITIPLLVLSKNVVTNLRWLRPKQMRQHFIYCGPIRKSVSQDWICLDF